MHGACVSAISIATPNELASRVVTSSSQSLLEAVQLLLLEVSVLKEENISLRKDVDTALGKIATLEESNEALTFSVQNLQQKQQQLQAQRQVQTKRRGTAHNSRSTKLRGSPDDSFEEIDSEYVNRLSALEDKLACVSDESNRFNLYLEGCNVHVRDGSGSTHGTGQGEQSGRGNLIIGYNEAAEGEEAPEVCSTAAVDFADCQKTGGKWGSGMQTGIHNLVVGAGHSFTQHSGLIVGTHNAITGIGSTVIGGHSNIASGAYSAVTGGVENTASGKTSTVLGGFDNTASGDDAMVGGGSYNTASGSVSTVIGGENNQAQGDMSFIAGGNLNRVIGEYACSTSSFSTTATGKDTSIVGGRGVVAALDETMIAGQSFGMRQLG